MAGRPAAVKLSDQDWIYAANKSKEYRKFHGLTQSQLAAEIECVNQQISQIERGTGSRSSLVAAKILDLPL